VWAEVTRLLAEPETLLSAAREFLGLRTAEVAVEQDELAEVERRIAEKERTLLVDVADYLRRGVPAEAVKAATDGIELELAALRSHRDRLLALQADSQAESERVRDVWALAERAASRMGNMTLAGQAEVLRLLDVRVTVLDDGPTPRLRVLGSVPHRVLLDRWSEPATPPEGDGTGPGQPTTTRPISPAALSSPTARATSAATATLPTHHRRPRPPRTLSQPRAPNARPSSRNHGSLRYRSCRSAARRSTEAHTEAG
jgi:hypothetical protein